MKTNPVNSVERRFQCERDGEKGLMHGIPRKEKRKSVAGDRRRPVAVKPWAAVVDSAAVHSTLLYYLLLLLLLLLLI